MEYKFPAYPRLLQDPDARDNKEPNWTDQEYAFRINSRDELMNLMGRRSFYVSADMLEQELEDLWTKEHASTASYGGNWGWYIGMDEIRRGYLGSWREARKAQQEARGDGSDPGMGTASLFSMTTPLIEIAYDNKTARGLWYSVGYDVSATENAKQDIRWRYEKVGADFVYEDGQWKIWHLVFGLDILEQSGSVTVPYEGDDYLAPAQKSFGEPTYAMLTHDPHYNWVDNYPAAPEPYETFKPEESYGPQGNKYYRYAVKKEGK